MRMFKISADQLNELFCYGYASGHHDTVEACYTDVMSQDRATYFEEDVCEWLEENEIKETGE